MPTPLGSLWNMYEIAISQYHEAIVLIQQAIHVAKGIDPLVVMPPPQKRISSGMLDKVKEAIRPLHLPVTKLALGELQDELSWSKQDLTYFSCGQLLVNLSQTIRRELQSVKVFSLDSSKTPYYESTEAPLGPDVASKFQSITYELDQAGKCYACDLTTAAAFHWIRSMEAGIRAMARCLGIPDPTTGKERNWSLLNQALKDKIDANWPKSSGRIGGDGQLFDKLYGSISGMQNPYRNETMHLSAKYTAPEALHIFELVKGLMTQIASRMDEDGNPKV